MYSCGFIKDEIKPIVQDYIKNISIQNKISSYQELINILSLMILFDLDYNMISNIKMNSDFEDDLILYLKSYMMNKNLTLLKINGVKYRKYEAFLSFIEIKDKIVFEK